MDIILTVLKCERCGHEWIPKKKDVKMCPKCKSRLWNKPKQEKKK